MAVSTAKVEIERGQIWVTRSGQHVLVERNDGSKIFPWRLEDNEGNQVGSVTITGNEFVNGDDGTNDLMHLVGMEGQGIPDRRKTRDELAQISGPMRRRDDWPSVMPPMPDLTADAETFRNSLPAPLDETPRAMLPETRHALEVDPVFGGNLNIPGAKADGAKIRPALVLGGFARALREVSKVGTFGAVKYTDNGWMEVPNGVERYDDAKMRHWLDEKAGVAVDKDTLLVHAAHEAWNALARLDLMIRNKEKGV